MLHQGELYMCINVLTVLTLLDQGKLYLYIQGNVLIVLTLLHQGKLYMHIEGNVLTILTLLHQGKFDMRIIAASRHILQRHDQTLLALLHQDKLCRKMSKQYSHCCIKTNSICVYTGKCANCTHIAASRRTLPENEQTILALLHQDTFYRDMSKQYSHCCSKTNSAGKISKQ